MAKISRKNQKVFAGSVPATNNVAVFGSLKAGSPAYSDDPDTIQSLAAFTGGWSGAVINNNAPALQDMNALFFLLSRQIAYLYQNGIAEYDATTSYYIGSLVSNGTGVIYQSMIDDNLGNAVTDASKWLCYYSVKSVDKTTTYTVDNTDKLIRATGASGFAVTIPQAASTMAGRELVIKSLLTGGAILTVNATGGSTIDGAASIYLSQYESKRLMCNGTTWDIV